MRIPIEQVYRSYDLEAWMPFDEMQAGVFYVTQIGLIGLRNERSTPIFGLKMTTPEFLIPGKLEEWTFWAPIAKGLFRAASEAEIAMLREELVTVGGIKQPAVLEALGLSETAAA